MKRGGNLKSSIHSRIFISNEDFQGLGLQPNQVEHWRRLPINGCNDNTENCYIQIDNKRGSGDLKEFSIIIDREFIHAKIKLNSQFQVCN
jgi:hypothetical protein